MVQRKPDSSKFDGDDQQGWCAEGQQGAPRRQPAQPGLERRHRRPLGERSHGDAEIVQQRLFEKDDRRGNRHEQQFEGVFEMAFHDTAN